jgi:hypothetical protein
VLAARGFNEINYDSNLIRIVKFKHAQQKQRLRTTRFTERPSRN